MDKQVKFRADEDFIAQWDYLSARAGMTRGETLKAAFLILEQLIVLDEQGKEFAVVDKERTPHKLAQDP